MEEQRQKELKLKILEIKSDYDDKAFYRGVDRRVPFYVGQFPEESYINQLFFWSVNIYEIGYLDDFEKAKELVNGYALLTPPQYFEIVELVDGNDTHNLPGEFLGYDVGNYWVSSLAERLEYGNFNGIKYAPIHDFLKLIEYHFEPLLNKFGLFDDFVAAQDFLRCILSASQLEPSGLLLEKLDTYYRVVGVHSVCIPEIIM